MEKLCRIWRFEEDNWIFAAVQRQISEFFDVLLSWTLILYLILMNFSEKAHV